MTAEIAILNKSAVALAADSAVTISAGGAQQKIFDSADKLFELSDHNPIGVMIYNSMDFMGTPLGVLVKDFRSKCANFETIRAAGMAFLEYLQKDGEAAPESMKVQAFQSAVRPLFVAIKNTLNDALMEAIRSGSPPENFADFVNSGIKNHIEPRIEALKGSEAAKFVGTTSSNIKLSSTENRIIKQLTDSNFESASRSTRTKIKQYITLYLQKSVFSPSRTGIVVAGFGSKEKFPSLIWFHTDGMLCGHLKYEEADHIDIDRSGTKAAVLPFAQKDMIERFLYGLDASIAKGVHAFCSSAVPEISKSLLERVEVSDAASKTLLEEQAAAAEKAFLAQLNDKAFEKIRQSSRREIEDMVEFMPKPEMAKMAEALIDLTSIKRRVTRGMETVGGPVDVAVISRSEGFVWVNRKHYFSPELNTRYEHRVMNHLNGRRQGNGEA